MQHLKPSNLASGNDSPACGFDPFLLGLFKSLAELYMQTSQALDHVLSSMTGPSDPLDQTSSTDQNSAQDVSRIRYQIALDHRHLIQSEKNIQGILEFLKKREAKEA